MARSSDLNTIHSPDTEVVCLFPFLSSFTNTKTGAPPPRPPHRWPQVLPMAGLSSHADISHLL